MQIPSQVQAGTLVQRREDWQKFQGRELASERRKVTHEEPSHCEESCSHPGLPAPSSALLHADGNPEVARWEREAANVTIIRDDWGIAHIYGKTDADAVFGMEYAQAEDDFNRIETNYINCHGPPRRGRRRVQNLSGPPHEALHRPRRAKKAIRSQSRMAQEP